MFPFVFHLLKSLGVEFTVFKAEECRCFPASPGSYEGSQEMASAAPGNLHYLQAKLDTVGEDLRL